MAIQHQPYEDFHSRLSHKLANHRVPFGGTFELTSRCNFSCIHCYLNGMRTRSEALTTDQIIGILEELAENGCLSIAFTGGEPLLRKDYAEVHRIAHSMGFLINVFTNGSLIDSQVANLFRRYPPRLVEISLYGGNDETYEKVTERKGQFEKVINGIDILLDADVDVLLKAVLLEPMMEQMDLMMGLAEERGLEITFDSCVTPTLSKDQSPVNYRVSPERAIDIELSSLKRHQRMTAYHQQIVGMNLPKDSAVCGAGFNGFHISDEGLLMKCVMIRRPAFDIKETGFSRAWDLLGRDDRPGFKRETMCYACDIKHLCGFCPGHVPSGEMSPQQEGFHCFVAKQRAKRVKQS